MTRPGLLNEIGRAKLYSGWRSELTHAGPSIRQGRRGGRGTRTHATGWGWTYPHGPCVCVTWAPTAAAAAATVESRADDASTLARTKECGGRVRRGKA